MSTAVAGGYELEAGKDNISVPETGYLYSCVPTVTVLLCTGTCEAIIKF